MNLSQPPLFSEVPYSGADCATGTEQCWPIDNVIDPHAESAAVANKPFYLFPAMADEQLDIFDAFPSKKPQLMRNERLAGDFKERFWELRGQRPHPRSEAAGKNSDWRHPGH
jgi:hypothetical protein